jgi:hypothetical protein
MRAILLLASTAPGIKLQLIDGKYDTCIDLKIEEGSAWHQFVSASVDKVEFIMVQIDEYEQAVRQIRVCGEVEGFAEGLVERYGLQGKGRRRKAFRRWLLEVGVEGSKLYTLRGHVWAHQGGKWSNKEAGAGLEG